MKALRFVVSLALLLLGVSACTSSATSVGARADARIAVIEDRIALKELVDTFSILADEKATDQQTQLFTEDAVVETVVDGKVVASLRGRDQIGRAFGDFLKRFDTVYHANGQLKLMLDGDRASGTSYCLVSLVGDVEGKRTLRSIKAHYRDRYVRQDGRWLISERRSTFAVQETRELPK